MRKTTPKKKKRVEISGDVAPQVYSPAKTLIEFKVTVDINVKIDIVKKEVSGES